MFENGIDEESRSLKWMNSDERIQIDLSIFEPNLMNEWMIE